MITKNTLFLLCSFCASLPVWADGGLSQPINPNTMNGAYAAINLGYGLTQYKSAVGNLTPLGMTPPNQALNWTKGNGGFAWGGDIGYQFAQHMAVELGFVELATATATLVNSNNATFNQFSSWGIDGALKFIQPIAGQFDVFGKVGGTYYRVNAHPSNSTVFQNNNRFLPFLAAGFGYAFHNSMTLDFTWSYLAGNQTQSTVLSPANVLTLGLGYKFES